MNIRKLSLPLLLIGILLLSGCNVDKDKLEALMKPKILEKEASRIKTNVLEHRGEYFLEESIDSFETSDYSKYSCDGGSTWGVIYKGKAILPDVYKEILLIKDFVFITKRESNGTKNIEGYGEYEEYSDWSAVVNHEGKIILPFSTEHSADELSSVRIKGKIYLMISSRWTPLFYDGETGEEYTPSEDEVIEQAYKSEDETETDDDSSSNSLSDSIYKAE